MARPLALVRSPLTPAVTVWLALIAAASASAAARAAADAADPLAGALDRGATAQSEGLASSPRIQLAALILNGRERASPLAVIVTPAQTLIALDYFVAALGLNAEETEAGFAFVTPLGTARIEHDALQTVQGYRFVPAETLARAFGARITFDPAEYALRVDLNWDADAASGAANGGPAAPGHAPDVRAPRASLSRWRSELGWRRDSSGQGWISTHDVSGVLGPGRWRARYSDDFSRLHRMDLWSWTLGEGNTRLLLGREPTPAAGVLPGLLVSGVQTAWSNRPRVLFDGGYGDGLIASRLDGARTLRGQGPAGGIAELRRDGRAVVQVPIDLEGRYQFTGFDLNAPGTEVAVFAPGRFDVPERIDQVRAQASDRLLPAGAALHYAAFGTTANPLERPSTRGERVAAYQWRQGLGDRVTVMAAVQALGTRRASMVGGTASLGALGVWSASAARDGGSAFEVLGEGGRGRQFWNAYARRQNAGFGGADAPLREDAIAEWGSRLSPNLTVSLVARHARGGSEGAIDYVLPAVRWQPDPRFAVHLRPDSQGHAAVYARWVPRDDWSFGAMRYDRRTQLEAEHRLGDALRLRGQWSDDRDLGRRTGAFVEGSPRGRWPLAWSAGLLHGRGRFGAILEASGEVRDGLLLRVQWLDDPLQRRASGGSGRILQVSLVGDFAVTPSGLARGGYRSERLDRGGISGRIDTQGLLPRGASLAGVGVLLDGRWRGDVDADGRFLIANLPPGTYALTLDSEKLPLELVPADATRWIEVRSGAVTRLDFGLAMRLGFSGRTLGADGTPRGDVALDVFDDKNQRVASVRSDAFGLYRVDGLPAGRYLVREAHGHDTVVVLAREFLFGIDLHPGVRP